ncbi:Rid family hydrolase [Tessaracoccus flavus]|uniref:Rid family hydrolase n=1 Tax=Tessaracoccus flavus TaxID=1610493 RepID=UPI003AAB1139
MDREFNIIGGDSLYEQTVAALGSCLTALESVGLGWAHVVRRTIYKLRPEGYFSDILPALQEVVPGQQPPQTLIGIPALAVPGTLIETARGLHTGRHDPRMIAAATVAPPPRMLNSLLVPLAASR